MVRRLIFLTQSILWLYWHNAAQGGQWLVRGWRKRTVRPDASVGQRARPMVREIAPPVHHFFSVPRSIAAVVTAE